ncbi:reverse transcriptase domain-containing protein [Tanacetum coccineum]
MYPFPKEGKELVSLMGYPYKCFLRLPKEYSQIRMAEDDEEKTVFHTEEGVYCFTHMLKELKNSAAKLQRMMEKDVKEMLRKLRRVNIKIDPTMSSFRVKEGKFLGYMVTEEGLKADPERIQEIILSPTPRTKEAGWTNEAEKALRRIKRKLGKLQTLAIHKEGETLIKEAEGLVMKKFFGQGEQVEGTPDANKGSKFSLSKMLQAKSTPTPRAWRLYLGKETIEEGSGAGIILVSPEENMHSYVICLKFNAFNHVIDCEALWAGLATSTNQGMKDLYVFINSLTLVAQVEGSHTPATKQVRKYKEEILDATTPFHRFRITYLLKILNPKAEVLTGLATIKLEFVNQEVSICIKTRPSVEETSSNNKRKATINTLRTKPNCNRQASGSK